MGTSVFDRLISDLTLEERRSLIDKLKTNVVMSPEPLITENTEERSLFDEHISKLSFFEKIYILLKALFTSEEKDRVMRDYLIDKLGRATEKRIPGYIDYSGKYFTDKFFREIDNLKTAGNVLKDSVLTAFELHKMNFLAFLGGWFLPEIQQRFLSETDPWKIESEMDKAETFDIRREIEFRIEDILDSISDGERKLLYSYSRSLHILNILLKFDFDIILMKFSQQPGKSGKICRFSEIRKPLGTLYNILYSFKYPPDKEVFKALYYYSVVRNNTDPADSEKLNTYMAAAEDFLGTVRKFNNHLPLGDINKVVNRNVNYNPLDISGGEDWFALYKKYWYQQFEQNMNRFSMQKKTEDLINQLSKFLGVESIETLAYYRNGIWGDDIMVRYEYSAGSVYKFLSTVYMQEMLPALKLILVDGKFYKEQNRMDFNHSFSKIVKTLEDIKVVDSKLSPGGSYDYQIQNIKGGQGEAEEKVENIKDIIREADREMESVIRDFISALSMLTNIVVGITHGEIGGPFDTLSNLGFIGKGENKNLIPSLVKIKLKIDNFLELFTTVFDLEREAE